MTTDLTKLLNFMVWYKAKYNDIATNWHMHNTSLCLEIKYVHKYITNLIYQLF